MTDLSAPKVPTSLLPANEVERLAALHRYDILDTSAEVAFDRATSLAARLFQMPTVLISLVDAIGEFAIGVHSKNCSGVNHRNYPVWATIGKAY